MHGSTCPSHRGAAGLVKSLDHDSLLSMGSCTLLLFDMARVQSAEGEMFVERGVTP